MTAFLANWFHFRKLPSERFLTPLESAYAQEALFESFLLAGTEVLEHLRMTRYGETD